MSNITICPQDKLCRPNGKIIDHIKASHQFLGQYGYKNLELLASYPYYITGVSYQKVKPEQHGLYICFQEAENKFDPNSLGIYDEKKARIGYAPKDFSALMSEQIPSIMNAGDVQNCILVCFCSGKPTERSAQCIYNLFVNYKSLPAIRD